MRTKTCEMDELEDVKSVDHPTFALSKFSLMMNGNVGSNTYIKSLVISLHNYDVNELKITHK